MNKLLILVVTTLILVGCDNGGASLKRTLHEQAILTQCTEAELILVDKEFKICNESSYLSSHCYDIAKVSHCKTTRKVESDGDIL